MKYIIFIISLSPFNLVAQNLPPQDSLPFDSTGNVIYSQIVAVDSATKDELYLRAKLWTVNNYKSLTDVIQLDDKENGMIIIKGNISTYQFDGIVEHSLKIYVKDGKYKAEIEPTKLKWYVKPSEYTKGGWHEYDLEMCYPATEKFQNTARGKMMFNAINAHIEFVINATNTMNREIQSMLISLNTAMNTSISKDW